MLKLSYNAEDDEDSRTVQWTVAESVLMNMHNLTVIDAIYSCLNLSNLLSLASTCTKGRMCWIAYKHRMFNVIKMLSKLFKDAEGFREMQRKTGAVIIGDVPLLYFTRSAVGLGLFEIAVVPTHAQHVVHQLICLEGFSVWSAGHWGRDIDRANGELACIVANRPSITSDSTHPHVFKNGCHQPEHSHYMCSAGYAKHMMFEKASSDGSQYVVRVWIATNGIPELILNSNSSQYQCSRILVSANIFSTAGSMNFISYQCAVSLYPSATLIHQRSYLLPMTPRSWQTAPAYPYLRTASLADRPGKLQSGTRRLYTVDDAPDLKLNIERHIGDRWSWSISFDAKGKVTDDPYSMGDYEGEQCLGRSRWMTKLRRNIPQVEMICTGSRSGSRAS